MPCSSKSNNPVGADFFKRSYLGVHLKILKFYLIRHLVKARAFE
jgi:hypothetical protein